MQTKCPFSLYDFWKEDLAKQINEPILNLASEEYAKIIRKYKPLVDVRFIEENGKEKGVYAKMARGPWFAILLKTRLNTLKMLLALMSLIMFLMRVKVQKNCTYFKKAIVMIAFLIIRQPFAFVPYMLYMPYHLYSR